MLANDDVACTEISHMSKYDLIEQINGLIDDNLGIFFTNVPDKKGLQKFFSTSAQKYKCTLEFFIRTTSYPVHGQVLFFPDWEKVGVYCGWLEKSQGLQN